MLVLAVILLLGMNQVRGKGIAFTNISEIRATKQLIQNYVSERFEDSFDKFDIKKNYNNLIEADLSSNLSYDDYYRQCYDEFVSSKRKMNELGLILNDYSFQSISENEQSNYVIVYNLEIVDNNTLYKDISAEFVGSHGKFVLMSLECNNSTEEKLLDTLNGLLFNY
ncbi:MAG: hypothetical protein Q4F05_13165 [bacterium]|nr:hypothetical protein [bacterium]